MQVTRQSASRTRNQSVITVAGRRSRVSRLAAAAALAGAGLLALLGAGCGSTTVTEARATIPTAVTVTLTSPARGSVVTADRVTVRGTVTPADAVVQIQGQPAAVGNGVFTGTATVHAGATTIDVIGSAPGATPAATSITVTQPSAASPSRATRARAAAAAPQSSGSTAAPSPGVAVPGGSSGVMSCGGDLSVGPNTSCPFAENVQAAYETDGPGTVTAYSPVTDQTYTMTCTAGTPVVCTGANDASVYFP